MRDRDERRSVGLGALGLLSLFVLGPATAAAQDAEDYDPRDMRTEGLDDDAARSRFRVGQALFDEGRFGEAAREFESAYQLSRRPSLLFNAYLAYRDGSMLEDAARALAAYLEADPGIEDASALEVRLRAIQRTVDEERARREREATEREALEAEARRLELEAAEARRREEEARRLAEGRPLNPIGFVVGGVGVAMLAGSLVSGLMANAQVGTLEDNCPDNRCVAGFDLEGERARADRRVLATDILLFGGAAVTVTGVVLLFVGRRGGDRAVEPSAACGPTGCQADLRVRF
ncbi:MAG: hypothetical protein KF901_13305 [Myxococcales bacterium]|nr:hypothetical protein [Myxococcales bacterium]